MPDNDDAITDDESATAFAPPIVDPRTLPVRFSRLKLMGQSAAHYYAACQRQTFEESIAMRIGSGVHGMLLGASVVKYEKRRAGKEWEAFAAEHAKDVILNAREWNEAQAMTQSLLRHREASTLLFDGTIVEQEIAWSYVGRACSSRPDARARYHISELKTARTSHPAVFSRDAIRMHYHGQLAFYEEANVATGGERYANAYIIAIEKSDPYPVTVYRLTERTLERGRQQMRLWMEQLIGCEAEHYWPAYSESIVDLDMPEDIGGPIEIEIDGQLTEVAP
jgi:3-phenylpropionate/cinnamic acid dioxygenase small subunit